MTLLTVQPSDPGHCGPQRSVLLVHAIQSVVVGMNLRPRPGQRAGARHIRGLLKALVLIAPNLACVEQMSFRRETTADKAACRNVARDVTGDDYGEDFNEAYNDCMLSKGYKPRD